MDGVSPPHPSELLELPSLPCHNLEAVGRDFWARATLHVPPRPSSQTGRLWVGCTGRPALVTLLMMDVSLPAREEGLAGHVPGARLRSCSWALPSRAI